MRLLLEKGTDVEAKGMQGKKAVDFETVKSHMGLVQLLTRRNSI